MQTCFSSDDPEYLPIPCTIVVHDEDRLGRGTIWGFYPHHCHVESDLLVSPGMTVSLSSISQAHLESELRGVS